MTDLIYGIFIYPLELIMEWVLEAVLSTSGNPLLSLLCVSLAVSIGSLPLYHLAEKWQDREREIQKKLKPKILELKSVFKGSVLNSYINTLYRQNHYHPVYAVRTAFGLLIQIPFFFAAYHLLSNYAGFAGSSSFLFTDLGKPDGLIKIGSAAVNLMPFIMTGINLISATIYGKKTTFNEKIQLYGMALFFLVVLYGSSSALLFYWTCNNLFSLIKNMAYNLIYKNGVITSGSILKTRSLNMLSVTKLKRPDGWVLLVFLLISALAYFTIFKQKVPVFDNPVPVLIITFLPFIIVVFFAVEALLGCRIFKDLPFLLYKGKETDALYGYSLFVFIFLAFTAVPVSILSSGSESDFEGSFFYFFNYLFAVTLFSGILIYAIYSFVPSKFKSLLAFTMVFVSFFSLLNVFVFTGSYGDMSHFIFSEEIDATNWETVSNIIAGMAVFLLLLILMIKKKFNIIKTSLLLIILSLFLFSVNEARNFSSKKNNANKSQFDKEKPLFTFSKNGRNVVVLMLDRFIGGYVPQLLEMIPELKDDLDGFVYYRNTLAPASYTIGGVPAIMGGWEYSVKEINENRQNVELIKKLDESVRIIPYNFERAGFDVTVYHNGLTRWFDQNSKEHIGNSLITEPDFPKYRDLWLEKHKQTKTKDDGLIKKKLVLFGLFRSAPLFLREFIYDDGEWHFHKNEKKEGVYKKPDERKYASFFEKSQSKKNTTLKYYAVLDFLSEFSKVAENGKEKFYFMTNDLPHEPYSINSDFEFEMSGKVSYPRTTYNNFGKSMDTLKHLYTDGASLRMVGEWIKWMKNAGVYDNTKIIIVSDHGRDVYNPFFKKQKISGGRKRSHPAYFNNLILVKDFNSRGSLQTSDEFMTNADVPSIAMKDIIEGINPFTNKKIQMPEKKFPFYAYDVQWRIEKQEKTRFKIHEGYIIETGDDINNPSKWKVIHE